VVNSVKSFIAKCKASLEFERSATQEVTRVLKTLTVTLIGHDSLPSGSGEGWGGDRGSNTDIYKRQTLMRELQLIDLLVALTDVQVTD
jgi:hypothetical protein